MSKDRLEATENTRTMSSGQTPDRTPEFEHRLDRRYSDRAKPGDGHAM